MAQKSAGYLRKFVQKSEAAFENWADESFEGMCYNKTDFVAQAATEPGRTGHRFCKTRGTRAF